MSNAHHLRSEAALEKTLRLANLSSSNQNKDTAPPAAQTTAAVAVSREELKQAADTPPPAPVQDATSAKWAALNYAHNVAVAEKRFRTLSESAEKLFEVMVQLCVDLHASNHLKEVMYQYRNMSTASSNPEAFSTLIKQVISSSYNLMAGKAKQQPPLLNKPSHLTVLAFEDQDLAEANIFQKQEAVVFYRETLANILEVTRKLQDHEAEYHSTCSRLINFCVENGYKDVLKRVCATIRNHVTQILNDENSKRHLNSTRSIKTVSFKNPETLRMNLQTRMNVLEACLKCNLWRESFFIVEEFYQLITMKSISRLNTAKTWFDYTRQIGQMCLECSAFDNESTFGTHQRFAALALLKAFEIVDKAKGPPDALKEEVATSAFLASISVSQTSQNHRSLCREETASKIKKLLRINHYQQFDRDFILQRAFQSNLLERVPENLKTLGILLKEQDSMPELVLAALDSALPSLNEFPCGEIYKKKLVDASFIYNLDIVSNIFSNIHLEDLKSFLPSKELSKGKFLDKISTSCFYLDVSMNLHAEQGKYQFEFSAQSKNDANSLLNAPSDFFTSTYINLMHTTASIKDCQVLEEQMNSSLVNLYLNERNSEIEVIKNRLAVFEEQLRSKEDLERMKYDEIQQEKLRQEQEIKNRHMNEGIAVQETKTQEQLQMVKKVMQYSQSEKLRQVLLEKGHGEVSSVDFEEIQEIKFANDLRDIEEQVQKSRKAENDMNHLSRQLDKENMALKSSHQLKEITSLPSKFKEIHMLNSQLKAKRTNDLLKLKDVFKNVFSSIDSEMDTLYSKRQQKFGDISKRHTAKLGKLADLKTKLSNMEHEKSEKLRQVEEKFTQQRISQQQQQQQAYAPRVSNSQNSAYSQYSTTNSPAAPQKYVPKLPTMKMGPLFSRSQSGDSNNNHNQPQTQNNSNTYQVRQTQYNRTA